MTIDELKMKVIDLEWAVMEKNSVDRLYFQQEIFDEITNLHAMLQASEADRDSWRERCEMLAKKEKLTRIRLENLKKYGDETPDIRNMYPTEALMEAKKHLNEIYGKDITEGDRLDPADYADLPFPDVEDLAPAEEVEGANE